MFKFKTFQITTKEMMRLYETCKSLNELLRKYRKNNLIIENLDFVTIGEFCNTLTNTQNECSEMLSKFHRMLEKYDMVFDIKEKNIVLVYPESKIQETQD